MESGGNVAVPTGISDEVAEAFLREYFINATTDEDLTTPTDEMQQSLLAHLDAGLCRSRGTVTIDVRRTSATRAVVDLVVDDMPFLVDSVTGAILQHGYKIEAVLHPIMWVERDDNGRAVGFSSSPTAAGEPESWMHVEIAGASLDADLEALRDELRGVIANVTVAVADWSAMTSKANALAAELSGTPPSGVQQDDVDDAVDLLTWLVDDNFTFLGYRGYELRQVDGKDHLQMADGSGLGILRTESTLASRELPAPAAARARDKRLLTVTKASSKSIVHRNVLMDYIGIKQFNAEGDVVGERRFLGLFTAAAYRLPIHDVPMLERKLRETIAAAGYAPRSHLEKSLRDVVESFPRDELFQAPVDHILRVAQAVMRLPERRQTGLFLRRDDFGRYFTALVFLPRDRYSTPVLVQMIDILMDELGGTSYEYSAQSTFAPLARLEFLIRVPAGAADDDLPPERVAQIERRIIDVARSWDDHLAEQLDSWHPAEAAAAERIAAALPDDYRVSVDPAVALTDIQHLLKLERDDPSTHSRVAEPAAAAGISLRLELPADRSTDASDEIQLKIFSLREPMHLSNVLPILQDLGMRVEDENTFSFHIADADGRPVPAWIYDFTMSADGLSADADLERVERDFIEGFAAVWSGVAESDRLNQLLFSSRLDWRQIALLRCYIRYLRMGGMTFTNSYVIDSLIANVPIVVRVIEMFEALFDPASSMSAPERDAEAARIREQIVEDLAAVTSLDVDRILSDLTGAVEATLRTTFYQRDSDGNAREAISLKLDPHKVPELPAPRPFREIWVYSPRFEGVHLRFGEVARGGLRWSDRRDDMRTEVLGLVKAQMVKNAIIIPTGAKGGFVAKRLPDPSVDRDAWMAEGVACYREFIRSMLQITDNRVAGEVVPPEGVVRRDADDPYLVVAADKGTATFSDFANDEAEAAGYWLGDAFASGGSVGYDHKEMAITARGAWESVRRHFRELDLNSQEQDFTVVGIGDMSGDVFGNGMLRSRHIRLVGAFDHRHVFVDPAPDAEASFTERQRLFDLPRSSWDDYDRSLISEGGGVWSRTAKSVPVSAQMRDALGLDAGVGALTPTELISAIMQAPVDLLWNGGIGTYVKASTETHAEVGDRANDVVRVDGRALRCRVVGEGGNLGFTQRGRIEYAMIGAGGSGGKINTDAIDNSAGVDASDHEVNIKIVLQHAIADGLLADDDRAALMASMTDEVAELVLEDNYQQNVVLAMEQHSNFRLHDAYRRLLALLEDEVQLDRALEFLPTDEQLKDRHRQGEGLTSPELSVILAYTKMLAKKWILASDLPEDPAYRGRLLEYFPAQLRERFSEVILAHPLGREIIATQVANRIINHAGTTALLRLMEETGASIDQVLRAQTSSSRIFGLADFFAMIDDLDSQIPATIQTSIRVDQQHLVERGTRWLLRNVERPIDIARNVERFAAGVRTVQDLLPSVLRGIDKDTFDGRVRELEVSGVPSGLAWQIAALPKLIAALDLIVLAESTGHQLDEVAATYFMIADKLGFSSLLERIIAMPRDDRWKAMARGTARDDLNDAHAALSAQILATDGDTIDDKLERWYDELADPAHRSLDTLTEILSSDTTELASIVVAVQLARGLTSGKVTTH